jgi:hypothetical protein
MLEWGDIPALLILVSSGNTVSTWPLQERL